MLKKGQEEMIGFALIIVVVAVIALVLLAISNREPVGADESGELSNFLGSAVQYTSDCKESEEDYLSVKELIVACLEAESCLNGKSACGVLNNTMNDILEKAFPRGGDVSSYYLEAVYNISESKNILILGEKKCAGSLRGADYFYPSSPGIVTLRIEGCYAITD
jgi:hypothetical protein